MAAPGTSGLFIVALVRHTLRCGEVVDVGHPLGGVWHVAARSVHDGLPEEKGWERQYKSDRLTCPDRMQNRCYSVIQYPHFSTCIRGFWHGSRSLFLPGAADRPDRAVRH